VNQARRDNVFKDFLGRGEEKITPKTFFQVLAELERDRPRRTIELRAKLVGGKLQFEPSPDLSVHDNEIVVGSQRIVVQLS
jgi:hypothetical protein